MYLFQSLVFLLLLGISVGISPSSVQYQVKSSSILDVELSTAVYSLTFPEEIYFPEATTCEYCSPSSSPTPICICDYTAANGCNACPSCDEKICSAANSTQWLKLKDGEKTEHFAAANSFLHFRFQLEESCSALDIRIQSLYGNPTLYVDQNGPPTLDSKFFVTGFQRPLYLTVCPSDPRFSLGTYFIAVQASGVESGFTITARSVSLPSPSPTLDTIFCLSNSSDHICIEEDGKKIEGYADELTQHYYIFNFTQCLQLSFNLQTINGADADIWYSLNNPYPYYQTAEGASERIGDDEVVFNICPRKSWDVIYITIDMWSLSPLGNVNYTLYVNKRHTSDSLRMRQIGDIEYYSAPQMLGSSAFFKMENTNLNCFDWTFDCKLFWPIYSSNRSVPFYPAPPYLYRSPSFVDLYVEKGDWEVPSPQSNLFQASVLLNMTVNGVTTTFVNEKSLATSEISLLYRFCDGKGNPISGSFKGIKVEPQCDYSRFQTQRLEIEALNSKSNSSQNFQGIRSKEVASSLLSFEDQWYGCLQLLKALVTSSSRIELTESVLCLSGRYTEEYNEDPCCSNLGNWYKSCVPRPVNLTLTTLQINPDSLQKSQCKHKDCIGSLLQDYQFVADKSCVQKKLEQSEAYLQYRNCKDAWYSHDSLKCLKDSDCSFWGTSCDISKRECLVDESKQSRGFISCLVGKMNLLQKISLSEEFGTVYAKNDSIFSSLILNQVSSNSCFDNRSSSLNPLEMQKSLRIIDRNCAAVGKCPTIACEDQTCSWQEDSCLSFCRTASWIQSDSSQCPSDLVCNWNSQICKENPTNSTFCRGACMEDSSSPNFFCGFSENGLHYHLVQELNTSSTCTGSVCAFPDVTIENGMNYELGVSSADCGRNYGGCTLPCNLNSLPPSSNLSSLQSCNNANECKSSGYCSINEIIVAGGRTGSCKVNRIEPSTLGQFDGFLDYPFCNSGEVSVPQGCIVYDYNQTQCNDIGTEGRGGKWIVPYTTKTSCENERGCYEAVQQVSGAGPNFVFTAKNQKDCSSSGGQWRSFYTWNFGEWVNGTMRSVKWEERKALPVLTFGKTLNFSAVQELFFESFQTQLASQEQSESICTRSRSEEYLNIVSCDCGQNSNSNCFSSVPLSNPVSEATPCENSDATVYADNSYISFGKTSIDSGCVNVLLSTVSALQFMGSSSNIAGHFIDVRKSIKFGISNKLGTVIGVLVGDGLVIKLDESISGTAHLCLALRDLGSSTSNFGEWDLASSDSSFTSLFPLNLAVVYNETSDSLCVDIRSQNLSQTYFPIKRVHNWESATSMDVATLEFSLSATLAVLFTLIALGSAVGFGIAIYFLRQIHRRLALTDIILIFLFIFSSIRAVYFAIMNRSPEVDFAMAALPTFLYFTTFSLIISFWAVTTQKFFAIDPKTMLRYGTIFVSVANSLLYIVLIIMGVLFHVFTQRGENSCGRRSDSQIQEKSKKLEQLAISYTAIVAAVSLLLSILFAYFGSKLIGKMKRRGGTKTIVVQIAAIFSVTFALHSIFIVVVAILSKNPSPIFSFIGLVVTEIIPPSYFIFMSTRYFSKASKSNSSLSKTNPSTEMAQSIRLSVMPKEASSSEISDM